MKKSIFKNVQQCNRVCERIKYIRWVKKDLFGCCRIEEIRDKDNDTGLKEGGEIEMSIYSAAIHY